MGNVFQKKAKELNNNRKNRNLWKKVFRPLALIAVFCTTYILILPAITMEGEAVCGFEEHFHSEECYEKVVIEELLCGYEENEEILHEHSEGCYKNDGTLNCAEPEVQLHSHNEGCYASAEKEILICEAGEHLHTEECFAKEEYPETYLCGMGIHSHIESCYDEAGTLICSIPEHEHGAECIYAEVDSTADTETPDDWEASLSGISFSGNWAKDILAVAESQIGYSESAENVILVGEELKGYTRYGEKYGDPYGDWSAMFVAFCAEYAGITDFVTETDSERWLLKLDAEGKLLSGDFAAKTGDIVFVDTDDDGEAELMGIVTGKVSGTEKIEFIAGDTENGSVEYLIYETSDTAILGYCELPENPMAKEEILSAEAVAEKIANLPAAEEAKEKLEGFNKVLDKESFDAYKEELGTAVAEIKDAHEAFDDAQKLIAGDIAVLAGIETVLAEAEWKELSVLAEDKAYISVLNAVDSEAGTAEIGGNAVFGFSGEIRTYADEKFGEARIKLEITLPLTAEKAVFDTEAMAWLEEPEIKAEAESQILTGYLRIRAETLEETVVPGTFGESIAVKILDMSHGEEVFVTIAAAMEHNSWETACETHGTEERLRIESKHLAVNAVMDEATQQAEYEALLAEFEALAAENLPEEELKAKAEELWNKVSEKYNKGYLSEEKFRELSEKISVLIYGDLDTIAEYADGYNWKAFVESGGFGEYNNYESIGSVSGEFVNSVLENNIFSASGFAGTVNAAGDDDPSDSQIREEGGENVSSEGAVYVSKTIDGTEIENVFDITLEVITQDIVTEVYKEPDMAVVIVMDISQTMNSDFGGSTRYAAAMTAAENFIKQFRQNNKGASKIGFVAFNTDAHQIFPLSQCYTAAQESSLITTMRNQTGAIINKSGYASAHNRFTNIEGGLKRAYDMLNSAGNEHKYVVFLSDGFPTTYLNTGTSAAYDGYDPYDANGTRFYDSVQKLNGKNRPCAYGTSYSDPAAIKARQQATTMKNNGVTIFSIGVGIGDQTIKKYVDQCLNTSHSVVDRRNTNYEIGAADTSAAFKNWLGNKIGSGYYYDSTNASGLNSAFNSIFTQIKELNAQSSHLDWVATDPMGNMGVHELDSVEFIGFYNKDNVLVEGDLKGESGDGEEYENTATFDESKHTIEWDIKKSGYVSTAFGNVTNYRCTLKYRVRLQNEMSQFIERESYDTNDVTSLTYRVIEQTGSNVEISERRTVEFPIPAVEGYLSELSFTKTNSIGDPLPGATFALTHDTESCGFCRGDGKGHVEVSVYEATSDENGNVSFSNIPSGHTYTLTETVVPDGYKPNGNTYSVKVSYDALTVTVTGKSGEEITWDEFIENEIQYVLPSTGGSGRDLIYTSGFMLFTAAAIMYGYFRKRGKREARE